jgi:ABC-type transporter Mla MlaB component
VSGTATSPAKIFLEAGVASRTLSSTGKLISAGLALVAEATHWCQKTFGAQQPFPLHAPPNSTLELESLSGLATRWHVMTFDVEQSPDDIILTNDLFRNELPKNVTCRNFYS